MTAGMSCRCSGAQLIGKNHNLEALRRIWHFPPVRIVLFCVLCFGPLILAWPAIVGAADGGFDEFLLGLYSTAVLAPATILATAIMARFVDHRSLADSGLTARGLAIETGIGIGLGFALISLIVSILGAVGSYHVLSRQPDFQYGPIIIFYLGIAISEEVIFRGYILQAIESRWGTGVALVVTCAVFGCEHIGNVEPESIAHMIKVVIFLGFGAGGLFASAYLMTRRLWLPIGLHWAWNFFLGAFYGLPVSGSMLTDSYIQASVTGGRYITGEKFGPECSVITLALAWGMAIAMMVRAVKNGNWKLHPSHARDIAKVTASSAGEMDKR